MSILRPNVLSSAGYVPGEQPTDPAVIKLNTNENPYPPSPKVLDAIHAITPEQLRKYPSPTRQPFREAAAKIHGLTPDHILPFNGGDELLSVAIRAAASEHDSVAFLEPSYSLYPVLTEMNGSPALKLSYDITPPPPPMSTVQSTLNNPLWSLPPNIENTPAKILLIVNPNAPSGHLDPLDRLAEIVANFKGLLVIDEAYVDFAPTRPSPSSKNTPTSSSSAPCPKATPSPASASATPSPNPPYSNNSKKSATPTPSTPSPSPPPPPPSPTNPTPNPPGKK